MFLHKSEVITTGHREDHPLSHRNIYRFWDSGTEGTPDDILDTPRNVPDWERDVQTRESAVEHHLRSNVVYTEDGVYKNTKSSSTPTDEIM